jgi:hypothetical protein
LIFIKIVRRSGIAQPDDEAALRAADDSPIAQGAIDDGASAAATGRDLPPHWHSS